MKQYKLLKDTPNAKAGTILKWNEESKMYVYSDKIRLPNGATRYLGELKETVENNRDWFVEDISDMRDIWADQMWDGIIKMNEAYRDCLQKQIEEDNKKEKKNELTRKINWPSEDKLMKTWQEQGIMFSRKPEEKEPIVISLIPGRKYLIGLADRNYDFLTVMTRKPLEAEEIEKRISNIKKL